MNTPVPPTIPGTSVLNAIQVNDTSLVKNLQVTGTSTLTGFVTLGDDLTVSNQINARTLVLGLGNMLLQHGTITCSEGNVQLSVGNFKPMQGTYEFNIYKSGSTTLVSGTKTISTGVVLATNECLILQRTGIGASTALGNLTYTINATGGLGVASFTINSYKSDTTLETGDDSLVNYYVIVKN